MAGILSVSCHVNLVVESTASDIGNKLKTYVDRVSANIDGE